VAWREKVTICILIFIANAGLIFYMLFLGKLLCPDFDKVWNLQEVSEHQGTDDYYAAINGKVYDFTHFYRIQHSDISNLQTTAEEMLTFAGQDLSAYFPQPLTVACSNLVTDPSIWLTPTQTIYDTDAIHYSGTYKVTDATTALYEYSWYNDILSPALDSFFKGYLVTSMSNISTSGLDADKFWAVIQGDLYDLTNYFSTLSDQAESQGYDFLDPEITNLFELHAGEDITELFFNLDLKPSTLNDNFNCLQQAFYAGRVDIRETARCQVSNYMLLVMAIVLCLVILIKFLASVSFGSSKLDPPQSKFVVCHIPVYTEGEQEIRRALDSVATSDYPNDRKLLFIVCDGMVTGSGNDASTPEIVLKILGTSGNLLDLNDSSPFRSVGEGNKLYNRGQVYSGLYEIEGNFVPYLVVVKVGGPNEVSKPGNRGKRDSQVLLMNFFNRVHFQSAMNPLELEMFNQLNNIIGVDPELYEFILMMDADTSISPNSLNKLITNCVNDTNVAGYESNDRNIYFKH
jgi:chitin synthase